MKRAEKRLVELFPCNGCMRYTNDIKQELGGYKKYKKGTKYATGIDEEAKLIGDWLLKAGCKPGKPYRKRTQFILPVYGKASANHFQNLLTVL